MNNLLTAYKATTAADAYILGFILNADLYTIYLPDLPAWIVAEDRESSSHGGARKLRIRINTTAKARLIALGAACEGPAANILTGRKNKGEAFEKWLTERAGQEWHKDSVPYWKDGDLTIKGTKYQIKLDGASLANEITITKALAAVQ